MTRIESVYAFITMDASGEGVLAMRIEPGIHALGVTTREEQAHRLTNTLLASGAPPCTLYRFHHRVDYAELPVDDDPTAEPLEMPHLCAALTREGEAESLPAIGVPFLPMAPLLMHPFVGANWSRVASLLDGPGADQCFEAGQFFCRFERRQVLAVLLGSEGADD